MTAEDHETATRVHGVGDAVADGRPDRFALMHGDYRLDNLLFDPDRTHVTVVDWQTLGAGLPARDLAYFTGTSLMPDVRANLDEPGRRLSRRSCLVTG